MSQLLAIRDAINNFIHYNRKITYPIFRFVLYAAIYWGYSVIFGYQGSGRITLNVIVVFLILSALLFPSGFLYFFISFLTAYELYFVAPELGIGFGLISTILYLLYFRYDHKLCLIVVTVPIAYVFNIPILIPLLVGMIIGYSGIVPMAFGIGTYYFAQYMRDYKTVLSSGTLGDASNGILYVFKHMSQDKSMWIAVITATVVVIVVNYIYHMTMDHAWSVSIIVGALVNILLFLLCSFVFDVDGMILEKVVQTLVATVLALLAQVYLNAVDFSRVERLEFSDDEYYYYVKAVPKVKVGFRNVETKKISGDSEKEEK